MVVVVVVVEKGTIWCWLPTGLVHTKTIIHRHSGGYLPHHFGAWQISTTIHLHSSE